MPSRSSRPHQQERPAINRLATLWLLAVLMPGMASALDYRSVSGPKAVLYDAPSVQGKKLYILGQGYPVEVIVNLGEWLKVRDGYGSLSWVEAKQLESKRTVLVTQPQAEVRWAADPAASITFRLEKDVVLDLLESGNNGWVKVRHRDGLSGYVLSSSVWGL